ncbi:MAG TPA: hypothetical protein DCW44_02220 [Eubacterium sp.]|nr:hypothetical protein [Eubacterium sp.]
MKRINTRLKRIVASCLAFIMALSVIQINTQPVEAATTATAGVASLGTYESIKIGNKIKSATWWKLSVGDKTAFCLNLGDACHSGNKYESKESFNWNQNTGGEKRGYYAKIIRWYVNDCKRSKKGYMFSQALIWSVAEGYNSESQLKDVIKDMKSITGYFDSSTVNQLYKQIIEPDGAWTASATYWEKTGNAKSYQTLMTVDSEAIPNYKTLNKSDYYRQRITIHKRDQFEKGIGGIQFTLKASNLDDLYSFNMLDSSGSETEMADEDNDTSFEMTGITRDSGRIAWKMTYKLYASEKVYYTESQLSKMSESELKAAKLELKDEGYKEGKDFGKGLSKEEAQELAEAELKKEFTKISNTYVLTEDNVGKNTHVFVDSEYAKGKKITLKAANSWVKDEDGKWPDTKVEIQSDYDLAYSVVVINKFKKVSMKINKVDSITGEIVPLGDASLDGAGFRLYSDSACKTYAEVYDGKGNMKIADTYTTKNGSITTDYLIPNRTYYLKEVEAPKGYMLKSGSTPIKIDGSRIPNQEYYQMAESSLNIPEDVSRGNIEIKKEYVDDEYGIREKEKGATFQVYLAKKGDFNKCRDGLERAIITTDENGYGKATGLVYGKYIVHQVDSGTVDTYHIDDFEVDINENGKVYTYKLENQMFKAYLKILKKSKNTEEMILKAGTTYQIYKVDEDGNESLISQKYKNENGDEVEIDRFITDETGEITTVQPLLSGKYHIYEVEAANGFHISDKFIEVDINSKLSSYDSYVDEEGFPHVTITVDYFNEETYGKLSIKKTGEFLTGWDSEKQEFVYDEKTLDGVKLEIFADGDILTQDNQGTKWYEDKELVASIITGDKVEFTKECEGITEYSIDEDGTIHINLPLGKYKVKEVETLYGYVYPEKNEWSIVFNWENSKDEYVLNSTDATDDKGVLNIKNDYAKPSIEVIKQDKDSKEVIEGAVFGIYTKKDIYNSTGEKIVDADTLLYTMITGDDGKLVFDKALPIMDKVDNEINCVGNSGDYYIKEQLVSNSYYLDETEIPIHLEYKDAETKVLEFKSVKDNTQTTNEIDKVNAAGSKEVDGCKLKITDKDGKDIISWTSGDKNSVKIFVTDEDGYRNLKYTFDELGNIHVGGLFHDVDYVLTETRPADGYVTADSIIYQLKQVKDEDGEIKTITSIKQNDGTYKDASDDKVVMHDEETRIKFLKVDAKTGKTLAGAKIKVVDSKGKEVLTFKTSDKEYDITGKLAVGETYTFVEISAPKGYKIAEPKSITVKDTARVQMITMKDSKIEIVPHVPQTGKDWTMKNHMLLIFLGMILVGFINGKRYRKSKKYN